MASEQFVAEKTPPSTVRFASMKTKLQSSKPKLSIRSSKPKHLILVSCKQENLHPKPLALWDLPKQESPITRELRNSSLFLKKLPSVKEKLTRRLRNRKIKRKSIADKARTANVAQDRDAEERRQAERDHAVCHVSAYIIKKDKGDQKASEENKDRSRDENRDAGERTQAKRLRGHEVHVPSDVGKFQIKAEGNQRSSEEDRGRTKAELEARTRFVSGLESDKDEGRETAAEDKGNVTVSRPEARNKDRAETEGRSTDQKQRDSREEAKKERKEQADEKNWQPSLEEISKCRAQAQQNSNEAIRAAQERYEREKQQANEKLIGTAQTTNQKASQAKEMTAQAKDATMEKGQQSFVAAADTISSAAKTAADYTVPVDEKAKDYTVQAAVGAKDVAKSTGGTTAEYASDLKDKAAAAGWAAAHFSAVKTVEGTKAAAGLVEGVAGYAGQKAAEISVKSFGAAKGLAAAAGESAMDYTARKKEEAQRELEAKPAAEQRTGKNFERRQANDEERRGSEVLGTIGDAGGKPMASVGETVGNVALRGSNVVASVGESLGDAAQSMKKPLDKITDAGGEVLRAVGEIVAKIGGTMTKPAEKVPERSRGTGVLGAIGETLAEIAETTKNIAFGESGTERGLEAKRAAQQQENHAPFGKRTGDNFQRGQEHNAQRRGTPGFLQRGQEQQQQQNEGRLSRTSGQHYQKGQEEGQKGIGSDVTATIGDAGNKVIGTVVGTVGDAAQRLKKPLDNITAQGGEVLGAVGETVGEIGERMIEPADKVQERNRGTGVLGAVGDTAGEIEEATRNIALGESVTERELEAKRAAQQQNQASFGESTEGNFQRRQDHDEEWRGTPGFQQRGQEQLQKESELTQTAGQYYQRGQAQDQKESGAAIGDAGNKVIGTVGETVGNAAERMKKPLDDVTAQGGKVLGAVGETVGEIGEKMVKPAEKVPERNKGTGVLGAVGDTAVEIAETTGNVALGDAGTESGQSDRGKKACWRYGERDSIDAGHGKRI